METLWIILRLRMALKINSVIYWLHKLPVIKKLLAGTSYDTPVLKTFATIYAIFIDVFKMIIFKVVYIAIICLTATLLPVDYPVAFCHIFVIFTLIGSLLNNTMFSTDPDAICAIQLLRMEARRYTVFTYGVVLVKHFLGMLVVGFFACLITKLPVWLCAVMALFIVGAKLLYSGIDLILLEFSKKKKGCGIDKIQISIIAVLIIISILSIVFKVYLPSYIYICYMIVWTVAGLFLGIKLLKFEEYQSVYKSVIFDNRVKLEQIDEGVAIKNQRNLIADEGSAIESKKRGFYYLNELFVKRHRSILWGRAKKVSIGEVVIFGIAIIATMLIGELKTEMAGMLGNVVPMFVFVMYFLNCGESVTQAMYINCDHSLLTYPFYKTPDTILKLFRIRVVEIVRVNLLPSTIIAVGIIVLMAVSGYNASAIDGIITFATIECVSIFFSIHYLVMYYMMQPYNDKSELKSISYMIVRIITYVVAYSIKDVKVSNVIFGIGTITFCVVYLIVACILVYRFAPKTFRIKN